MGWLGGYGCGFGHGAKGTKYEKMLGSLIVESSDGKVKFNVGSGFTDKLRENPSQFLDKVIEVRYNDVVQNKDEPDFHVLYLPSFTEYGLKSAPECNRATQQVILMV